MPAVLFALKRTMNCRSQRTQVHEPEKESKKLSHISTKKSTCGRSGCSRSIANLKDVISGSKRHPEKAPMCSPRSIGSSELLNPITHEVVLDDSTCELKISGGPDYVGVLKPGTPGPGGFQVGRGQKAGKLGTPVRRSSSSLSSRSSGSTRARSSSSGSGALFCPKCDHHFLRWEAVEAHFLSQHAVTELGEGDSSRRIVEIICRTSSSRADNHRSGIERILKVHNMQKTLAQFEEYREVVKIKANKLAKKHPRCLADGNELLRFHGSAVECSLGMKGSSSLCTSEKCRVCRILRHGFSAKKEANGSIGVFTASTSSRAFETIRVVEGNPLVRTALIVCRVIAGRVHRPLENLQEIVKQSGFDSVAGKVGVHSNIEELYLLSPRALLPCFVVIYKS